MSVVPKNKSALLLAALVLTSCNKEKDTAAHPAPRPVITFRVPAESTETQRRFSGETKAARSVQLGFEVPGRIQNIIAVRGRRYPKGTVLAQLDPASFKTDLANAQAQSLQAIQQLRRTQELFESGNASQADFDTAIANQKATKARLESAQLSVDRTNLLMPYDGIVADIPADLNQVVAVGTPVIAIQSNRGMDFETGVPAEVISLIEEGESATISLGALHDKTFTGTVTKISPIASSNTTYPVTLSIKNADQVSELRADLDGEAQFYFPIQSGGGIAVPSSAVASNPDGTHYLWLVKNPDQPTSPVTRIPVEVGLLAGQGNVTITSGLTPNQLIVTKGIQFLTENLTVTIPKSQ